MFFMGFVRKKGKGYFFLGVVIATFLGSLNTFSLKRVSSFFVI